MVFTASTEGRHGFLDIFGYFTSVTAKHSFTGSKWLDYMTALGVLWDTIAGLYYKLNKEVRFIADKNIKQKNN